MNHYTYHTKRGLAKVYRQAANLIDQNGLCKGMLHNAEGEYCMSGALFETLGILSHGRNGLVDFKKHLSNLTDFDFVFLTLATYLNTPIVAYNDRPSTSKKDVVSSLRKCARALEHGASIVGL